MKYLSLDLETTCLQPHPQHILQVSMVVEDTDSPLIVPVESLPHFTCFVKHDRIEGEAFALGMNGWILDIISGRNKDYKGYQVLTHNEWVGIAEAFLNSHFGPSKITVAGKNVAGFDIPFLPREISRKFRHKVLDPGPMMVNWKTDDQVPNFDNCKKRAGIDTPVAHDAREDAMDVIRCLRTFYENPANK